MIRCVFVLPFFHILLFSLAKTVDAALGHFTTFLQERFSVESQRVRLNLFGVDSTGLRESLENVPVEQIGQELKKMRQMTVQNPRAPPKLGTAISTAAALSREQAIPGVNQILLLLSMDGSSRHGNGSDGRQPMFYFPVTNPISTFLGGNIWLPFPWSALAPICSVHWQTALLPGDFFGEMLQ